MFRYSLSWYIFTLTLLESIIKSHLTVHDNGHGFIANGQRQLYDDFSVIHEEIRSMRINDVAAFKLQLKFEPAILDFKNRPLGIPHLEKVTLFNVDRNKSIDMTSISGSTVHFHSSFFEDKKIPPLGNTSFNVIFLGREEGSVESNLFIHTTEGHFKYNVKGASIYSPYRLRPIVGIKLPINASFSPLIYMHNPHSEPIQIMEVYSSGGEFHLELPTGEMEGPKDMWEIPPLQTRPIIRVKFQAETEQNHTAYVRIKVNSSEEILVVPLEVEVTSQAGLFDPQGSIDFGIGGSLDSPKEIEMCVYNPLKKAVRIHSISTSSQAIQAKYDKVKLPGARSEEPQQDCVKIGTLTLDWKTAFETEDFSGKVIIKYRNGKSKTEIPYYITVLKGGLSYDPLTTRYFINDKSDGLTSRSFKVRNKFLTAVRLINVSLPEDAQQFFQIENFRPVILKSQQEAVIFTVKLRSGFEVSDLKVNSHVLVKTNISDITVPLLSYNGKFQVYLPFKSKDYSLDLGLISFESTREVHFLIANNNPVSITVKNVKTSIPMTNAVLVGCGRGSYDAALLQVSFQNLTKCTSLKVDEYAIVRLTVQTSNSEGQIWGDVQIESQYENLSVPVHFKVAPGKLEIGPDRLVFDQCFPGKICSHPLRVHSTFNDLMIIEDIISLPPDGRLSSKHTGHILARATKVIGHLYLDPTLGCGSECYTGLQHDTTAQWLKTLTLSTSSIADVDLNLVNVFYNRYLNLTSNLLRRWQNLTLRLDTSEVRGHVFKTRVKMSWPSLLLSEQNIDNKSIFTFPLTQIGNVTYRNITIRNPASYNLVVQMVIDHNYPDAEMLIEGMPSHFIPAIDTKKPLLNRNGFFFHDESFRRSHRDFYDLLGLSVHGETLPVLLRPGQNFTFTVGFRGEDEFLNTALIFIRNNLTILEVVRLKGQAAHPIFKFGNRKPGSLQPLLFELTDKHMKDCESGKPFNYANPSMMVKRSFTAKNTGQVTIYINGFYINDLPCEGYGFKVLNCTPFALLPNASCKIDIAFTPDMTLSTVTRLLALDTSLNFLVNYTLFATIPKHFLPLCQHIIPPPSWQAYMYYVSVCVMFVMFVFIVLLAVMDAERIKKNAIHALMAPGHLSTLPTLDLRKVGEQTRAEIRSSRLEDKKSDAMKSESKYGEKYTAIVPATGRSKRKLSKKNSNEIEDMKKPPEPKKVKPVAIVAPVMEEKKTSPKDKKINNNSIKKIFTPPLQQPPINTKNTIVPAYEEETSSTTTESSNNDDNDNNNKEPIIDQRTAKIDLQRKKSIEAVPPNNSKQQFTLHTRAERRRSNPKTTDRPSSFKNNAANNKENTNKDHQDKPERNYNRKNGKDRKDKHHANKKLSNNEKNSLKTEKRDSPPVRVSPSITGAATASTSPIWGENRATFSDVVASSVGRPRFSHNDTQQAQYKQTPSELGPIGSKRIDYWNEQQQQQQNAQSAQQQSHSQLPLQNNFEDCLNGMSSNSYFSNAQDLAVESGSPVFLDSFGEAWTQNHTIRQLMESSSRENDLLQGSWNQNLLRSSPNSHLNSYWTSGYTPLAENLAVQQQMPDQASQPDYLWSSRVWQPWAPEPPRTPTRTPPGFDAFHQTRSQEESAQREAYSPFGLNDIWTQQQQQQQQNPWDYPGQ